MSDAAIARLFNPRSIAIIGASPDASTINGQPLSNLVARGYAGALYPVNPKHPHIAGMACYPDVASLPEVPDLALILLSADRAVQAVVECGRRGVAFGIVIGAGFAEVGAAGQRLQHELVEAARAHGIRLLGPNCIGLMNLRENVFAGFGPVFAMSELRSGGVSMVTQSGGFGFSVVNMAEELGVGFRYVVSTGNEADLTSLDILEHLIEDEHTAVIAAYFEGIGDAHRLPGLARRALSQRKPVIVWKVGSSPEGQRAALSHTGTLGGTNELYQAVFDQFGWSRIQDVEELVDYTAAFARAKLPENDNIGIVTVSGGAGVLLADGCAALNLQVPQLTDATRMRLARVLPAYATLDNPVDVTASVLNQPDLIRAALTIILDDPAVGSLLIVASSVEGPMASKIAEELVKLDAATHKPVLVSWSSREARVGAAYEILRGARIPLFRTPTRCCKAVGALCRFAGALRRHERDVLEALMAPPPHKDLLAHGIDCVTEKHARLALTTYGFTSTVERLATTRGEAIVIAAEVGFPVAMKIQSVDIPHKTEAGGVQLNVCDAQAARAAFDAIVTSAYRYAPGAVIEGVLIQEMVVDGVETILGVINDEHFGPVLMFGLGGIFTEVLRDVVFRFSPIGPSLAREMIASIRGRAVLEGARGRPAADVEALADAIVSLSRFAHDYAATLSEIDINPLIVLPRGLGVRVVDVLIGLRGTQQEHRLSM
ncbi:acetate--CoA ligase family protein [Burkholderia sp. L27(2015)]|uniref:acetate--CoA ligase family protein n=1 Tax=Burkholderia sp. L27(2015) TaxID=1641858 RepID=UPI00131CC986|nr:acetate--CoA ligase family protein [Burkholderia sp. L27(2015)]